MTEKLQKFERLAEKRVSDAIKKLRLIGNLSNKNNYSYTEDHVKQLVEALETEMRILKGRFEKRPLLKNWVLLSKQKSMIKENRKIDNLKQKNYTVASLFAGIGGFCLAFKNVGFDISWANEKDPFAIQTYKHNFPDVRLYEQSITDLSVLRDQLEVVDVLTAGFPCQPFSVAGFKNGFNDPRGKLFFDIIRLLREFGKNRPKILLLENVKNLLTHDSGKTFSRIMAEIQSVGYWFKRRNVEVLNTLTHTNIPQNRERLYMAALSSEYFAYNDFKFPEKTKDKIFYRDLLDLKSQADSEYYLSREPNTGIFLMKRSIKMIPILCISCEDFM